MNNIVSNQIVTLRKERKMTQQELADAMNVSTAAVCKWETGNSIPDINTLCRLADYFNVSVDYILGREKRAKKCVIFCNRKEYEKNIRDCAAEHDLTVLAYISSVMELEQYLEKTPELVPMVIDFSTEETAAAYNKKMEELSERYGFALLSINAASESEFGAVLDIYMENFK